MGHSRADINYPTALSGTQLNATASGSFVYSPTAGTVLNAGSGQTLSATFTLTDATNYNSASKNVLINVLKATPVITWSNPADITYGTALSGTQLNATASVAGSFVYSPTAGTVLSAGNNQTLHVDFTPTDSANYNSASKNVLINVLKATPVITWSNPADITYPTALGGIQLNATASVPGTFAYTPAAGTVLNAGNGQTLSVTFTPTDATNYNSASKNVLINVLKATPVIAWANPADITYGTTLGATQLNATADVSGSFVYGPTAGTVLNAGNGQTLSVAFTPDDTTNYIMATASVLLNVTQAGQTINFGPLPGKTYGDLDFQVNATASSGLAVSFMASGNCTILNGNTVHITGAGSCAITAQQDGDSINTYQWTQTDGPPVTLAGANMATAAFTAPLITGGVGGAVLTLKFNLTASDGALSSTSGEVMVTVEQVNHPPTADAGTNQTVSAGTIVTLNGSGSHDPDNDPILYTWIQTGGTSVLLQNAGTANPTFTAPGGATTLTFKLRVGDGELNSTNDATVDINVVTFNDPPLCNTAQANPPVLWPPNHKLIPVNIVGVSDPNNDQLQISITQVTQDEPVNGLGDGDTSPDAVIQGNRVLLRAERGEKGNGRVYRVYFMADDGHSGICSGSVLVRVPSNQKPGVTAIDDGQLYDSTQ